MDVAFSKMKMEMWFRENANKRAFDADELLTDTLVVAELFLNAVPIEILPYSVFEMEFQLILSYINFSTIRKFSPQTKQFTLEDHPHH